MKITGGKILLGILILVIALVIYIIWDNNRIKIVEQNILVNHLPDELDGFTILQITDLHEKEFGENQTKLIEKINSIDYDAIVFTGDMLVSENSKNYDPYYDLLEGINNKENALFVPGNSDPNPYTAGLNKSIIKHDFIEGMNERGVGFLESIYSIKKESSYVHFVDFELAVLDSKKKLEIPNDATALKKSLIELHNNLLDEISKLDTVNDNNVVIALNHYPVVDAKIDQIMNDPNKIFRNFDLIMAGHYHGGQIRLPFIGALFVPEPYYERSGIFPPQDRVKGLWEYKQTKQYVSAGLGSSRTLSFLKFRLFNPPEINVLTLKKQVE